MTKEIIIIGLIILLIYCYYQMSQSPDQVSRSTQTDSRPTTEQATQYNQEDIKPGNSGAGISNFPYPNQVFEKYFSLLREKIEKDDLSRRAEYDRTEKEVREELEKLKHDQRNNNFILNNFGNLSLLSAKSFLDW